MSLPAGARLGPYEIVSPAGAGGMGEVYKAKDTRLDRTVAVKVLSPSLAEDAQFRERFEREARAISALEHPNICPLYDVGTAGETHFLVMQYLDGETLAQRIARGPLPLDEALRHAIGIADALDRAHSRGLVHRDLKPGNVMLVRGGAHGRAEPRLLDFGLAKTATASVQVTGPESAAVPPTMTTPLTGRGTVVGTVQYMAPEQIEAGEADARSDIWAFGCVLYEMLTGRRAFEGKSHASLIGAILKDEPPRIDAVQPLAPAPLDQVVRRCLAKDPEARWQHIRDVRNQLQWIAESPGSAASSSTAWAVRVPWLAGAAVAGALLALVLAWAVWRPAPPAPQVTRFAIDPPFGMTPLVPSVPAVSPDGSRVVFAAGTSRGAAHSLYVRPIDQPVATPIAGTDGASDPFFSPDGRWLGFFAGGQLQKMPLSGGAPAALAPTRANRGATFTNDGRIVYAPDAYAPLSVVGDGGGTPQPLTTLDRARGEMSHRYPRQLPDGRIVFGILTEDIASPAIAVVEPGGGPHRVIIERAMAPQPLGNGYLLYAQASAGQDALLQMTQSVPIVALPYRDGHVSGTPVPVLGKVLGVQPWGVARFAAAPAGGTLVSSEPVPDLPSRLAWVALDGSETPVGLPVRGYEAARVSPDGRYILALLADEERRLWLADPARGVLEPFASEVRGATGAVWSPDGAEIALAGTIGGEPAVGVVPLANPSGLRRVSRGPLRAVPTSWRAGGPVLAFMSMSMQTRTDVQTLSLADGSLQAIASTQAPEGEARFSPDGAWLAMTMGDAVYVQPYPGPGRAIRVSPDDGEAPVWGPTGRVLYYQREAGVYAASFEANGTVGQPRLLFERRARLHDIHPDGKRMLFAMSEGETAPVSPLVVTLGWLDRVLPPK